jgi:hypothetical protein
MSRHMNRIVAATLIAWSAHGGKTDVSATFYDVVA